MGFLSRLFGGAKKSTQVLYIAGPGTHSLDVVGESHYQKTLETICGGHTREGHRKVVEATLICEDDNPKDKKAVRVDIQGNTVGHLDRDDARQHRKNLRRNGCAGADVTCSAMVVGGWNRGKGNIGYFGVKLDYPVVERT